MHLSPFYTRMYGEWLRYANSTSQYSLAFSLYRDDWGFQVNPLCRHDITRSDRQIGNHHLKTAFCIYLHYICVVLKFVWWSESFKCDKYAKKKKIGRGQNVFTPLYIYTYIHTYIYIYIYIYIYWDLFIISKLNKKAFHWCMVCRKTFGWDTTIWKVPSNPYYLLKIKFWYLQ